MATPEPLAVGKCLLAVMPEKWTKSIPAALATSLNRKTLGSCGMVGLALVATLVGVAGARLGAAGGAAAGAPTPRPGLVDPLQPARARARPTITRREAGARAGRLGEIMSPPPGTGAPPKRVEATGVGPERE